MTIESNNAIAIATVSDWLQNLAPIFSSNEKRLIAPCTRNFSRPLTRSYSRLLKLQVIAWSSDWFIALFAFVVIGRRNYFGIGFSTVI